MMSQKQMQAIHNCNNTSHFQPKMRMVWVLCMEPMNDKDILTSIMNVMSSDAAIMNMQ